MSDAVPAPSVKAKAVKPAKAVKAVAVRAVKAVAVPAPKKAAGRPSRESVIAAKHAAFAAEQRHYKLVAPYQGMSVEQLVAAMPTTLVNQRNTSFKQAWVLYVTGAKAVGLSAAETASIRDGVLKLTGIDILIPFAQTAPDPTMTETEVLYAEIAYKLGLLGEALTVTKEATLSACLGLVGKGVFIAAGPSSYKLTDAGAEQLRQRDAVESVDTTESVTLSVTGNVTEFVIGGADENLVHAPVVTEPEIESAEASSTHYDN